MRAQIVLAVALLISLVAMPVAEAETAGCSGATTANPRPSGWFSLGKPSQAFADDCFHQFMVNAPDTASVDVVILPPPGPMAARDISLLRQSVQMWEDGVDGMAQATGRPWLAAGFGIQPFVLGLDTDLPGYEQAVSDPEVLIVTADTEAGAVTGFAGQGSDFPIDFCHGLPNPVPSGQQVAALPGFDAHHGSGWGTMRAECGDWGGRVCIVAQAALFVLPDDQMARNLFDLNSHEFGHCLGLGHVGDASDFAAMAYPPDDIMSYAQDTWNPEAALCVSNLDVKTMAYRYGPLIAGAPAMPEPGVINGYMTMPGGKLTWPGNVVGPEYLGTTWRILREDGSLGTSATECPQPTVDLLADPLAVPEPKTYGPTDPPGEPVVAITSPADGATDVASPVTITGTVDPEGDAGLAAHAGGPYGGAAGAAIAIAGSATGATGTATCAWATTGGGSFADAAACSTTVTYASAAGSPFTLTLTVTDSTGSDTDTAVVNVASTDPGTRIGTDAAGDRQPDCGTGAPAGCDLAFADPAAAGLDVRAAYIKDMGDAVRFTVEVQDATKFALDPVGHPAGTGHMNTYVLSVSFEAVSPTFGLVSGKANIERATGQPALTGSLSEVTGVLSRTTPNAGPVTVDASGNRFSVDIPKSSITFFAELGTLSALDADSSITVENGNVDSIIEYDATLDVVETSTWSPAGAGGLPGVPTGTTQAEPAASHGWLWRLLHGFGLVSDGAGSDRAAADLLASNGCSGSLPQSPTFLVEPIPSCTLAVPAGADHVRLTYTGSYSGLFPAYVQLFDGQDTQRANSIDGCEAPATLAVNGAIECTMDVTTGVLPGTWTATIAWQLGEATQEYELLLEAFDSSSSTSSSSSSSTGPSTTERVELYEGATLLGSDGVATSTGADSWSVSGISLGSGAHTVTAKWFADGVASTGTPLATATSTFTVGGSANQAPTAAFSATPSGLSASFDATASSDPDGDTLSYAWAFGDGGTATGATVSHTYAAADTYTVVLTVSDGNGGSDTESKPVTVASDGSGPTAITITGPAAGASVTSPLTVTGTTDGGSGFAAASAGALGDLGVLPADDLAAAGLVWQPWMSAAHAQLSQARGFVGLVPPAAGGPAVVQAVFTGQAADLGGIAVPAGWTLVPVADAAPYRLGLPLDPPVPIQPAGRADSDLTAQGEPWREGLGPGSQIVMDFDGDGFGEFLCTANFVWQDQNGDLYLGAAGHCFLPTTATATENVGGEFDPSGLTVYACRSFCILGGQAGAMDQGILIQDFVELGPVAYARQTLDGVDVGNDFGLVRIPASLEADVDPTMPVWGGPDGTDLAINKQDLVLLHGNAAYDGEAFATKSRVGLGLGNGFGLTGNTRHNSWAAILKSSGGDSGSAVNTAKATTIDPTLLPSYTPLAGGILTHGFGDPVSGFGVGIAEGTMVLRAAAMATEAGLCIQPLMAGDDPLTGAAPEGPGCESTGSSVTVEVRATPSGGSAGAWQAGSYDAGTGAWQATLAELAFGETLIEARLLVDGTELDTDAVTVTVVDSIGTLTFGTPVTVGVAPGQDRTFRLEVPADVSQMTVATTGAPCTAPCTLDADLYLQHGAPPAVAPNLVFVLNPVTDPNACSGETNGNEETCDVAAPAAGTWYVTVHAYAGAGNVSLVALRDQADLDGDGIPDSRDIDRDGDGVDNEVEALLGQDPDSAPVLPEATVCAPSQGSQLLGSDFLPLLRDFDGDGVPAVYANRNINEVTVHEDGTTSTSTRQGYCWLAGDPNDDGQERAPTVPVGAPEATFCVPSSRSQLLGSDMLPLRKDFDGDGLPAVYANRAITEVTLHDDGTVTTAERSGYCWLAGDPDDDGDERAPTVPVEAPAATFCAPGQGSQLLGSDFLPLLRDFDGDGVPAVYANRNINEVTVHEDGTTSTSTRQGYCWLAGDPNDDGQERAPTVPVGAPEATFCVPSSRSQLLGSDMLPLRKDFDGDGLPAVYANRAITEVTLHDDGTVTTAERSGYCWLAGDLDDDGTDRTMAPGLAGPDGFVAHFQFDVYPLTQAGWDGQDMNVYAWGYQADAQGAYQPYHGDLRLVVQRDCGALEPVASEVTHCDGNYDTIGGLIAPWKLEAGEYFFTVPREALEAAFGDGSAMALHFFVQAGSQTSNYLEAKEGFAFAATGAALAQADQWEQQGFTPVVLTNVVATATAPDEGSAPASGWEFGQDVVESTTGWLGRLF